MGCGLMMMKFKYLADEVVTIANSNRCSLQFEEITTMVKIGILDVSALPVSSSGNYVMPSHAKTVVGFITRKADCDIDTSDEGYSKWGVNVGIQNCAGYTNGGCSGTKASTYNKKTAFLTGVDELL